MKNSNTKNIMFFAIVFVLIVSIGYFSYQLFYEISSNNANNKIKSSIQSNVSIEEETSYEVGGYDESKFPSEVVEEKTIQSKNTAPIFKPSDIQPSKFIKKFSHVPLLLFFCIRRQLVLKA